MISLLILIIIVLLSIIGLMIKFGTFLIKNLAKVILLIILILSLIICAHTYNTVATYHQIQTEVSQIIATTQERADLLPIYSLETVNHDDNRNVEHTRKQYYNQKLNAYHSSDLSLQIDELKQANASLDQLHQEISNNKSHNLQHALKKDQRLTLQYQHEAKTYSILATAFNNGFTFPITKRIASYWVPTGQSLPILTKVSDRNLHVTYLDLRKKNFFNKLSYILP